MFGWGPGLAIPSASSEPDKERKPPTSPTPLDFPVYQLPEVVPHASDSTLPQLFGQLAGIKRPQDICLDRFKPLNLHVETDVRIRQMFPADQAQSLPPLPWEAEPSVTSVEAGEEPPRPLMSNGLPFPPKDRFETLKNELLLDKEDAFREVSRMPPREGRSRVRVTQSRKFWTGLEHMAQYWDTSLDNYFERPATPQPTPPAEGECPEDGMQTDDASDLGQPGPTETMDVDSPESPKTSTEPKTSTSEGEPAPGPTIRRYTGRRIGSGTEMPDDMRDETIRAFVEMAAWPFGCQVTVPTLPPRLSVKSLLFPVRQSFQASRSPRDRTIARSGILEGPVLIAQCRPDTLFRTTADAPGNGVGEVCDIFREVGGMLLAAQERAREGAAELRPGEGKWWTNAPRFGGAPHDSLLDDIIKSAHGMPIPDSMLEEKPSSPAEELESARKRHKFEHPFVTSLARKPSAMRKMSSGEKWKILQPGPSLWDKRMKYMQIGKVKESPYDDIYMVSSINHHVAILHLRVHRRYLDILTTGESTYPPVADVDQPWHVLKLQRTRCCAKPERAAWDYRESVPSQTPISFAQRTAAHLSPSPSFPDAVHHVHTVDELKRHRPADDIIPSSLCLHFADPDVGISFLPLLLLRVELSTSAGVG
ncbi:hypothetical protein N7462_009958 [Penicillium macrosclerotiorum]|uniref:uncharacterized protein n=1 Tax=Penicillium macrosclerotiorum TaxID=303699 RepID=UPI0025490C1E|nr:uncharacterized protein N7462_009958 [Penicillium macrosclerotiorum]KAJ5668888.1 hypothetical protein N7462_009958 [Penicillium macrosclerotiorum]